MLGIHMCLCTYINTKALKPFAVNQIPDYDHLLGSKYLCIETTSSFASKNFLKAKVIRTYNISTQEAEAGEFHKSEASLSLHSEFQASQNRTSLKTHIYQKTLKM